MNTNYIILFIVMSLGGYLPLNGQEHDDRHGWPAQKAPEKLIVCDQPQGLPESMLLESLSGLAAQAVNEGKYDTMVWTHVSNESYQHLYEQTFHTLGITSPARMDVWELLSELKRKKVVKGYILYKEDKSKGDAYSRREGINISSNVATVYAALKKGILIEESLEERAKEYGLKCLKDARNETLEECFARNKVLLNNQSALSVDPRVSNCRDFAIAQKLMLYYDTKEISERILEWVLPLSPILGWNCGDEDDYTGAITRWGHYNTASNWCSNLCVIASVSGKTQLTPVREKGIKEIDFSDLSACHSFVMSDGDNMQWLMGAFVDNPIYLGNKTRDRIGLSWTACPVNLSVISPFTWNRMAEKYTPEISYIEYGGGYQYPDQFAINRPNRPELLRRFAKRLNMQMNHLGIKVFGFICKDVNSKAALEAYQIYAEEMTDITGMIAVQYYPYELSGEIIWVSNKKGVDIPVVAARYSLWDDVDANRPRCGTPEYVASLINRDYVIQAAKKEQFLSWTIVHAWSDFSNTSPLTQQPSVGFNPVQTSSQMLVKKIKKVSTNELLWRIRMKYRPEQTKAILVKSE